MKKLFLYFLLLLASTINVLAQKEKPAKEDVHPPEHLRIVKLNGLALALKNISAQYEMSLSRKISVALGFRFMPSSGVPFKSVWTDMIGDGVNVNEAISNARINNIAVTPEMRIYLGKGYGQGLYIAPYYRFVKFKADDFTGNYKFKASGGVDRKIAVGGDLSAHTGGILLGMQWPIAKRLILDWWIIGAHFGGSSGVLTGRPDTPFSSAEQEEIRNYIEDVDLPLLNKSVNVTANRITVNFDGAFGGLRSGLCLGFRF